MRDLWRFSFLHKRKVEKIDIPSTFYCLFIVFGRIRENCNLALMLLLFTHTFAENSFNK